MKVKELVELLLQLSQEAAVVVEDEFAPPRKEFRGDYGYGPTIVFYEHDDGPIAVIAARKEGEESRIEYCDDRRQGRYDRPASG